MVWIFLLVGGALGLYLVHSIGGTKLPTFRIPTASWFREIKIPRSRSFKPVDLLLLATRAILIGLLVFIWSDWGGRHGISEDSRQCLLVLDDTWSTHAQWSRVAEEFSKASQKCPGQWTWWFSHPSPFNDRKFPQEASYVSKSLSAQVSQVLQWMQSSSHANVEKIIFVTDGQLQPQESRLEIERLLTELKARANLEVVALGADHPWNISLEIIGNRLRVVGEVQHLTAPLSPRVDCQGVPAILKSEGAFEWSIRCPKGKADAQGVTWIYAEIASIADFFTRDQKVETLWTRDSGRMRIVVVDHHLGSVIQRPSFFVQQLTALVPELDLSMQAYAFSPEQVREEKTDLVLWFEPMDLSEVKKVSQHLPVLVWPTSRRRDEGKAVPVGSIKGVFRSHAFEIPSEYLCCAQKQIEDGKGILAHVTRQGRVWTHTVPFEIPRFSLPLSTLWAPYFLELMQALRDFETIRVERILNANVESWPLTHLKSQKVIAQAPPLGLEPGIYQKSEVHYLDVTVGDGESSLVFSSDFQLNSSDMMMREKNQPSEQWLWTLVLLFLILEVIQSCRLLPKKLFRSASILIPLFFFQVHDGFAKGSEIAVFRSHPGALIKAYEQLRVEVSRRTSIELEERLVLLDQTTLNARRLATPYVVRGCAGSLKLTDLSVDESSLIQKVVHLDGLVTFDGCQVSPSVPLPADHPLFRSFYLIGTRTGCGLEQVFAESNSKQNKIFIFPNGFLSRAFLEEKGPCTEGWVRLAVNWVMNLFAADYKNDQVHLPFLLERIR